ncbi:MAG: hypothetical protein KDI32_10175 [Pseudomonadales bacterium]|nr:hypothetical protein [Pseudomonadales bacterium]
MSIDWITVAAQIANFLVLVWLLKRFLYRPILDGIDAREQQITERMSEAARIRAAAAAAAADHKAQIEKLQAVRESVIEEVRAAAKAERDALLVEARERLTQEQLAWQQERLEEARRYRADLQHTGVAALLSLTRKALDDLSGETLEERIVARATSRLLAMTDDLAAAAGDSREVVVTTREPLPQQLRKQLESQLVAALPDIGVQFLTDPDQSPGLLLRLGAAQLGWTVAKYIDGLQTMLDDMSRANKNTDAL